MISGYINQIYTASSQTTTKHLPITCCFSHYVIYDNDNEGASSHVRDDSFNLPPHMNLDGVEKQRIKLLEMRKCRKRNQAHSVVGTKVENNFCYSKTNFGG